MNALTPPVSARLRAGFLPLFICVVAFAAVTRGADGTPPTWLPEALVAETAFEFTPEGTLMEASMERRQQARDRLPAYTGDRKGWNRLLQVLGR